MMAKILCAIWEHRKRVPTLWVLLIVSSSITFWSLVVCVSVSLSYKGKPQQTYRHQRNAEMSDSAKAGTFTDNEQDSSSDKQNKPDWLSTGIAVASLIVAIYAFLASSRNADAAEVSAKAAINSANIAHKQSRAYLSYRIHNVLDLTAGEIFRFEFIPINYGHTPAFDYAFRGHTQIVRVVDIVPEQLILFGEKWNDVKVVILPQGDGHHFVQHCDTPIVLTENHVKGLFGGTHVVIIGLELRYRDIFGDHQSTQSVVKISFPNRDTWDAQFIPGSNIMT